MIRFLLFVIIPKLYSSVISNTLSEKSLRFFEKSLPVTRIPLFI